MSVFLTFLVISLAAFERVLATTLPPLGGFLPPLFLVYPQTLSARNSTDFLKTPVLNTGKLGFLLPLKKRVWRLTKF